MIDTVRCSLWSSARPQCRWMPSFCQRWHARIGKLHVCKHLNLKSKSRKGCQNVLCRICYSNPFLACASHVAASCARHALAFVPHIWPDVEILVALLWACFLLPVSLFNRICAKIRLPGGLFWDRIPIQFQDHTHRPLFGSLYMCMCLVPNSKRKFSPKNETAWQPIFRTNAIQKSHRQQKQIPK
jgi:hypothetical protein